MAAERFTTRAGVSIERNRTTRGIANALDSFKKALRTQAGGIFASGYEYPGRYNRWDIGFLNPPLELKARGSRVEFLARSERGEALLKIVSGLLAKHPHLSRLKQVDARRLHADLVKDRDFFPEEERSRQPSLFSLLRTLQQAFYSPEDTTLGWYGAFGYDLVFQFEPIELKHSRDDSLDAWLYLPDHFIIVDRRLEVTTELRYNFAKGKFSTVGLSALSAECPTQHRGEGKGENDHRPSEYADKVREVQKGCRRGDTFEVVLSQVFRRPFTGDAFDLFDRIQNNNPSPYEFILNFGEEQLVGASPEMFVRVEGQRVETCPISGTIARGASPIEDADQIAALIASAKDEAELTMCTDVDRNDKSRVCRPETVRVLGRRLIEMYSRVIHTVDHVEAILQPGRDGLDAFLSHLWAVTVSGAPKAAAMQVIENLEKSPRRWFGGAIGSLSFSGDINTGITIRTVRLKDGQAEVRVGATLLAASDPDSEQRETEIKAEAFLNALEKPVRPAKPAPPERLGRGRRVLFVDHQDSFVHTLAGYVRRTGAEVMTLRSGFPMRMLEDFSPDLVFLSPGPYDPAHFGLPALVRELMRHKLPIFGVCLGLQGIVEALGGELAVLSTPQHGVRAGIIHDNKGIFEGLPNPMSASRYHSLYAVEDRLPAELEITSRSSDNVIMSIQHRNYPMAAVQFHPESIHALRGDVGFALIQRVMKHVR